jgi:outer membrane lipoprotein carrier protein
LRELTSRLFLLLFIVASAPLVAEEPKLSPPGSARQQLDRFSDGLSSLRARFEQRVVDGDGKLRESSEGEVWLRRPRLFRWEYGGEFPEIVVADGERVWIYDVALEQVTVRRQSEAEADSPLSLLTEPSRLDERFAVREAGEALGFQLLELRSLDSEAPFERLLLGLGDGQLRLMIMEDAFGLRTELRFTELARNPTLEAELFVFTPPDGVDVIGEAEWLRQEP